MSLCGAVIVIGSLFAFMLLLLLDAMAHGTNPYLGILTYMVAPFFTISGALLTVSGLLLRRRKLIKAGDLAPSLQINLSRLRDRKIMAVFLGGAVVFLLLTALGSYQTYHFTESVTFCGEACHKVMSPELISYHNGPHARVSCTQCHIGAGAKWYVRSKISGAYQVYATLANKYPTPIPTPIKNLRPAQETCEQCHWPNKFVGNLDRTYSYYLTDQTNTEFVVRLLLKVGGGDPTHGPVEGIHWHMNVANKIEYIATDHARQNIPWVRMTDSQGVVSEFRTPKFTNNISQYEIRTMDCMDCHNRPAHVFKAPNPAVNLAMQLKQIDPSIPSVKSNALYVLSQKYETETEALQTMATTLAKAYPNDERIRPVIAAVHNIYTNNFFPEMKADWKVYPNNIGHMHWPGCFRCHDGLHKTSDGKNSIKASDCNACHTILSQGAGKQLEKLSGEGFKFEHPGGDLDPNPQCNECHSGAM